jgi:hypothetical protein
MLVVEGIVTESVVKCGRHPSLRKKGDRSTWPYDVIDNDSRILE